jgi:hypothetical protein
MLPSKRGERQRKSENKQTYFLWFSRKGEDREYRNKQTYLPSVFFEEGRRERDREKKKKGERR